MKIFVTFSEISNVGGPVLLYRLTIAFSDA